MKIPAALAPAVAKAQRFVWSLGWIRQNFTDPANPLRYIYGAYRKAWRPQELLKRKRAGRRVTADLDPEVTQALRDFQREGMVKVSHLVEPKLLHELAEYFAQTVVPRREQIGGLAARPFFAHLRTEEDLANDGVAVRFAMQKRIVQLITAYMGKVPFIRNISFLESNGIEQTTWEQSQLWHLDYYHTYLTPSMWVYLSDVEDDSQGPFTYLPAEMSARVKNTWVPRRVLDKEIEQAGLVGEIRQVKGPRLTCFIIDNSRTYHLGSRMAKGERRSAYIAHYVDPISEKPWLKSDLVSEETKLLIARE